MLTPYIPLYGEDIGMPIATIGYLVALYHLAQFFGRIPMGTISDVIGYKKTIGFGGLSLFFSAICYIASPAFSPLLFIAQILLGITVCMEWVTLPAYVSRFAQDKIPFFTFIIGWAYTFSIPFGGFLKDNFGMNSIFYLALLVSVVALFLIAVLWRIAPSQSEVEGKDLSSHSVISLYKSSFKTLKNPKIMRASLYSFLMFLNLNISFSLFPLHLSGLGLTASIIGIIQFARAGASSSVRLLSKRVEEKIGREKILIIGTLTAGFCLISLTMVESFSLIVLISIIWGLGGALYAPVVFTLISEGTSAGDRGKGMGIRGMVGTFGSFTGIIVFSNIAETFSTSLSISLAGLFIILGVGVTELLMRRKFGQKKI